MGKYEPPFDISNTMLYYVSNIMENVGRLNNYEKFNPMPELRKNSTIKSIHSSLSIEANSLSINQVKDVIEGHIVIGEQKEIQEVKNAYNAYQQIDNINPYYLEHLKQVHGIMGFLTVKNAGNFRTNAEGVFDGDKCIFMAPSERLVPELMNNLFEWINDKQNDIHPLILSSIFHYEFLFIHPFTDGNGRMARLWQNIILSKWKNVFKYVPIETQIKKYQQEYYSVISQSHVNGNSNVFIEFMLKMINETLIELLYSSDVRSGNTNKYVEKLLNVMKEDEILTAKEIMDRLPIKSKESFRKNYLIPAIDLGLIYRTNPDKPTSKNQMYYKA